MARTYGRETRSLLRRAVVVVLVVGLFVLLPVLAFIHIQSPAEGSIISEAPVKNPNAVLSAAHFQGKTMSIDYPTVYTSSTSNPATGNMVEQYSLKARLEANETRLIAMTIMKGGTEHPMNEESAYRFRHNSPDVYTESVVELNKLPAIQMSKKDGSEVTFFISGPINYAIIAMTSTHNTGGLNTDAVQVTNSFRWL